MKIFNLQSKTTLIVVSIVLGLAVNYFIQQNTFKVDIKTIKERDKTADCRAGSPTYDQTRCSIIISETDSSGFPIKISAQRPYEAKIFLLGWAYNGIIWILAVFVVLLAFKYFSRKKVPMPTI